MTIEELQEQLLQEQEQRQKLQADYDNLKAKNEELVANNARLTDYNNKLFMRVTEPVQEQQKQKELVEKLNSFRNGDYDILLGTQMVAKGLNFPKLSLVGVILADTGLHMPDFRAAERTFSLITQVAGRAGRYFPDGKVLVQTYNPGHESIAYAVSGRVRDFYELELSQRSVIGFPPFSRLVRMVFRSANQGLAWKCAEDAAKILETLAPKDAEIIGPAECPLLKISQNYRYQILLKGTSVLPLQTMARKLQKDYTHNQNVYIEYDVDPVSLL